MIELSPRNSMKSSLRSAAQAHSGCVVGKPEVITAP